MSLKEVAISSPVIYGPNLYKRIKEEENNSRNLEKGKSCVEQFIQRLILIIFERWKKREREWGEERGICKHYSWREYCWKFYIKETWKLYYKVQSWSP